MRVRGHLPNLKDQDRERGFTNAERGMKCQENDFSDLWTSKLGGFLREALFWYLRQGKMESSCELEK